MSMTKRLWSLSALAVELGHDRRTVAAALSTVPADGIVKGNKAWFLPTALRVLNAGRGSHAPVERTRDLYVETFVLRAREWRTIHKETGSSGLRLSIDDAAAMYAAGDRQPVLTWLQAGLPFDTEGDWETGEGFILVAHWVTDWVVGLSRQCTLVGDNEAAHELQLDCMFNKKARAA